MKRLAVVILSAILALLAACAGANPTRISGFAMDTDISVTVYGDSEIASDILNAVTALENKISWSIEDSDTYILNSSGQVTSKLLADIISVAGELYNDTDGAYSLAVRELCALWDINSGKEKIPSKSELEAVLTRTGSMPTVQGEKISLSKGQSIDLGSLGKGAACDIAADYFESEGRSGVAAIGSSIALCGKKPNGDKWSVAIAKPDDRNSTLGTLYLDGGSFVSTSNGLERGFTVDGKRYHHIMDAATGYPAESDIESVTVIASSGIMSDALSTACYIVGYDKAVKILDKYGAKAVFTLKSGEIKCHGELSFEVAK